MDSRGRVIGINTAMIHMAQGISFAVPVDTARWVVGELLTKGKVRRAYLGLTGQIRPVSRRAQRVFDLVDGTAVEVVSLERGGPAYLAGLRRGDLIISLNNGGVATVDDIHRQLADQPPGSQISLGIVRGGKRKDVSLVTGEI